MEGHQSLKENNVRRVGISRIRQAFVLNERVLWDRNSLVALLHHLQCLVGQVEVKCRRVVEIVLGGVNALTKT